MKCSFPKVLGMSLVLALSATVQGQQAATSPASESSSKKDIASFTQSAGQQPDKAVASKPAVTFREPTKEETQVLLEGMKSYVNDSADGLRVVKHPDGRLSMDHEGRFQNVMVAKRNADGTISIDCATGLEQVRQFLEKQKTADAASANGSRAAGTAVTPQPNAPKAKSTHAPQPPAPTAPAKLEEK